MSKKEIRNIQLSISQYEALGTARLQIMEIVGDQLVNIDKQRKETKAAIANALKGLKDVKLATATANLIAPIVRGADEKDRKRLSKRRSFLKGILKTSFPDYDFDVMRGNSGGGITAVYVGCADTRTARRMLSEVKEVFALLDVKLPKAITETDLVHCLKAGTTTATEVNHGPVVEAIKPDFSAIAAKLKDVTPATATAEKQAIEANA